jgi:dipeptidyl aminopeptidase/acylaminoacyl peptidase
MLRSLRSSLLALLALAPVAASAQKKVLTQADWDRWQSIQGATLSNDGKWVAYTLAPQVGDGEFIVRSTTGTTEIRVPVGYISRPNNTPGGERGGRGGGGGGGGRGGGGGGGAGGPFTADGKYAFVTAQPNKETVERQQRAAAQGRGGRGGRGQAAPAAPQNTIMMISLADGKVTPQPQMRSYRLAPAGGRWMVYTPAPDSAASADSAGGGGAAQGGRGAGGRGGPGGGRGGGAPAAGGARRSYGNPIVLRDLETGADERIADVSSYTFDDSARVLVYTVTSRDSTKDGIYVRDLAAATTKPVLTGPGNYRAFTFDTRQQQFVFTSDRDDFGKPGATPTVYLGSSKNWSAQPVIRASQLPASMRFPDNVSVGFTRAANALTFPIAPPPEDTIPADSLVGKARFDLWHWKDPQLQTQQLLQVNQARNRTYQAVFNLSSKRVVQLTTDSFPSISLSDDAKIGLANTGVPYNIERMWGEGGTDVYLVDPATASRKLIRKKISGNAQLSPDAKYVIFYDNTEWYAYNIATGKEASITGAYPGVHWEQETWSTPNDPGAWGVAGWTENDRSVLIHDRFDIWELDPNGVRPAVVLTDSLGRREHITFRIMSLDRDPDERFIDTSEPVWLSAFDEDTKQSGFFRTTLNGRRAPQKVVMDDVRYGNPQKADNAPVYMVTKSTFVDFPNLWVGPNLTSLTRVTDANAFQKEYNWGTVELVNWFSSDGVPRQGLLYKPENFDPSKKYPMISYFYEDLSDGLHNYIAPTGRNVINPTHYVSNGYLVFEPDIYYEIGHPGPSAMKSIVPGVQMLLQRGYVDPKGLGLQGQSWGGYQTSYIITQTSMFSAAMAGATVANMTSAYGGIRWGSGLNRSMQYENGQSRIGKSLWEAPQLYIENSPLFHLDRVTTPLLMMHNDQDDAVPWYQGIEMFVGMRRLGKEVYMVNYNNDVHNPASRANQKDIAMRMQQFFDNKLKGAPAPDWMIHGIPAKDKGKDQVGGVVIRQ